jgi:hypothetical protein
MYSPDMWNACATEPSAVLRWIECHPGLAAWVQAVGTIAAVLLAMAVPVAAEFFVRRGHTRQVDHVTSGTFLRLRRALVSLQCESDLRLQWLARLPTNLNGTLAGIWLEDMHIPIGQELTHAAADPAGLRSDFSRALLLSLENASQFNSWVTRLRQYPEQFFPDQWATTRQVLQDIARKVCENTTTAIGIGTRVSG